MKSRPAPQSEDALLSYAQEIEGMTFAELAYLTSFSIPEDSSKRKGWTGMALEYALGANAGCKALPDFQNLNIELKSIPIGANSKPSESTFVTSIPLQTIQQQTWKTSDCFKKLSRVLWVPVEGDKSIAFEERRIGRAVLWSPNTEEESILSQDWHELTMMLSTGQLEKLDASMGTYLQVRPKAADAKSLCYGFDAEGNKVLTLPRGFYLRATFTSHILRLG